MVFTVLNLETFNTDAVALLEKGKGLLRRDGVPTAATCTADERSVAHVVAMKDCSWSPKNTLLQMCFSSQTGSPRL